MANFEDLIGKTIASIAGGVGDDEIRIVATDGKAYRQYHSQDCCESVQVEEIVGDIADVIGSPILLAEEVIYDNTPEPNGRVGSEDYCWTFYKLRTLNGDVTIRWLGESNGYYSNSVDFEEEKNANF